MASPTAPPTDSLADSLAGRFGRSAVASLAMFAVAVAAATIYTSSGGAARDLLVQELLVNFVIVMGLQVFIGSTGIVSFGHLAFTQIAAYGVALCVIPAATKAGTLPNAPFGIADLELGPVTATVVGVVVAVVVAAPIGVAVARAGGLAATMITLAVLFAVDQVVKNWQELTRGAGGLSGVPQITTNTWLWIAALGALLAAHLFRETRIGRFAVATRDDEIAAPAIGIDPFWPRWTAWVVSIVLVGLAGALRVQMIGSTNPQQYSLDVGILLLAMLVVGGMRTVSGAFVGTALITIGNEAARQLGDRHEIERLPELFLGVVLLAVMLVRPGGLLGDADLATWLRRRSRRLRHTSAPEEAHPDDTGGDGALVVRDVVVQFEGFRALDGASLRVRPGEIVGLIGPNGAGKTTLFNVVTGLVPEESGTVRLGERDLSGDPPYRIARAGLARTFQNLRLFATQSVRENVALAALSARRYRPHRPATDVDALLANAGLADVAERRAATLDYGNQRRLELARAAALSPEFLLLDEPTSGMSNAESLAMVDHVRATARGVGAGVLVIDHDLAFVTRISDHIVGLAGGRVIAEGTPEQIADDPAVAEAYLGRREARQATTHEAPERR
ncbi:MAG: branched-chain amino acid ABC transporter ATP-binding protein/permease [Actinomycetota bacterium]|nr:branched-chain amino acid ABC transporter ATP-binding protein/permease [Actinomycetota bacterium]MDQ3350475.1 branched-chain amino acid ABC transporter ATP-binding protein/permease [Actinomycetota bacterium]